MKIIVDAFGGDNAPVEVIKGSVMAVNKLGIDVILVGNQSDIRGYAASNQLSLEGITIKHTNQVMNICDDPVMIIKEKINSSMAVGLKMLADGEGDAFVSAGSTAALVVGSTFIVKRLKGIKRAALATMLPTDSSPTMLLDVGANADCRPEMLIQFAIMGSCYMNRIMGVSSTKVGLVNIGSEPTKGRILELDTFEQLKRAPVNFIGNIETRDLPDGESDVLVTDGFTGNIILKLYEGMGSFFGKTLKDMLLSGMKSKLAAALLMDKVKDFKKKMDYSEYGGAPLLGTAKPVIKAHGSSKELAFFNAIRQAKSFAEKKVIEEISIALASMGK
ncbi:MAG: phosphate acyltransferase PlsX [Oscillospiraceae bacterium]|jgi:glycerol-3-phosphate acyltransferase PlsX